MCLDILKPKTLQMKKLKLRELDGQAEVLQKPDIGAQALDYLLVSTEGAWWRKNRYHLGDSSGHSQVQESPNSRQ